MVVKKLQTIIIFLLLAGDLCAENPPSIRRASLLYLDYQSVFSPEIAVKGFGRDAAPPLNPFRITGEIAWGTIMGFCGGGAVALPLMLLNPPPSGTPTDEASWGAGAAAILGFIIGYPIGSAYGVYQVGNRGDETGSFTATMIGSIIGAVFFVIPAPIGATIAFNMTRGYKNLGGGSLINIEDSEIKLALPEIYLKKDFTDTSRYVRSIQLVNIGF